MRFLSRASSSSVRRCSSSTAAASTSAGQPRPAEAAGGQRRCAGSTERDARPHPASSQRRGSRANLSRLSARRPRLDQAHPVRLRVPRLHDERPGDVRPHPLFRARRSRGIRPQAFPNGEGGPDSLEPPWNVENHGQHVCGAGELGERHRQRLRLHRRDEIGCRVGPMPRQRPCLFHRILDGWILHSSHRLLSKRHARRRPALGRHARRSIGVLHRSCTDHHLPRNLRFGHRRRLRRPLVKPRHRLPASATLWAKKNGCKTTYSEMQVDGTEGGKGTCYTYDGCPNDGQVELCRFDGMDHCWAGGATKGAGGNSCPKWASATNLEWSFFKTYAW